MSVTNINIDFNASVKICLVVLSGIYTSFLGNISVKCKMVGTLK